jgi:hypothetical protein
MSVRTNNNNIINKNHNGNDSMTVSTQTLPTVSIPSSAEDDESSLARVIDWNNRACYLLSSGQEDEQVVLEMFHTAIACLSSHASCAGVPSDVTNANALAATFQTQTLPSWPRTTSTTSTTSLFCVEGEGFFELLDRPILIHEQNPFTVELYPLYAGCILCNTAIVYHRMAIHSSSQVMNSHQKQLLAKAFGLYRIVFESLSNTGLTDDTTLGLCTVSLYNIADLCRLEDRTDYLDDVIRHLKPLIAFQQHHRRLEQQQQQRRLEQPPPSQEPYHLVSSNDLGRITFDLMIWKVPVLAAAA